MSGRPVCDTSLQMAESRKKSFPLKIQILYEIPQERRIEALRVRLRAAVFGLPILWLCLVLMLRLELPLHVNLVIHMVMLFLIGTQSYALLNFPL